MMRHICLAREALCPTADALRAVICMGNIKAEGDMAEDADGSEPIRRRIFAEDPLPTVPLLQ